MRTWNRLLMACALAVFVSLYTGGAFAGEYGKAKAKDCDIQLSQQSVKNEAQPTMIEATVPMDIAQQVSRVEAPADSGLKVELVKPVGSSSTSGSEGAGWSERAPASTANKLSLRIDASKAKAGSWQLAFHTPDGPCHATLTVQSRTAALTQ